MALGSFGAGELSLGAAVAGTLWLWVATAELLSGSWGVELGSHCSCYTVTLGSHCLIVALGSCRAGELRVTITGWLFSKVVLYRLGCTRVMLPSWPWMRSSGAAGFEMVGVDKPLRWLKLF